MLNIHFTVSVRIKIGIRLPDFIAISAFTARFPGPGIVGINVNVWNPVAVKVNINVRFAVAVGINVNIRNPVFVNINIYLCLFADQNLNTMVLNHLVKPNITGSIRRNQIRAADAIHNNIPDFISRFTDLPFNLKRLTFFNPGTTCNIPRSANNFGRNVVARPIRLVGSAIRCFIILRQLSRSNNNFNLGISL